MHIWSPNEREPKSFWNADCAHIFFPQRKSYHISQRDKFHINIDASSTCLSFVMQKKKKNGNNNRNCVCFFLLNSTIRLFTQNANNIITNRRHRLRCLFTHTWNVSCVLWSKNRIDNRMVKWKQPIKYTAAAAALHWHCAHSKTDWCSFLNTQHLYMVIWLVCEMRSDCIFGSRDMKQIGRKEWLSEWVNEWWWVSVAVYAYFVCERYVLGKM